MQSDGQPLKGNQRRSDLRKQEFAKRLRQALVDRNWNQSDLARAASQYGTTIGRDSISVYCRGRSLPGPVALNQLAQALGVNADDLLPGSNEVPGAIPTFEVQEVEGNSVWLRLNQRTTWPKAMKIMEILKESDGSDG